MLVGMMLIADGYQVASISGHWLSLLEEDKVVFIWREKRQMYTLIVVGMHFYYAHVALLSSTNV